MKMYVTNEVFLNTISCCFQNVKTFSRLHNIFNSIFKYLFLEQVQCAFLENCLTPKILNYINISHICSRYNDFHINLSEIKIRCCEKRGANIEKPISYLDSTY